MMTMRSAVTLATVNTVWMRVPQMALRALIAARVTVTVTYLCLSAHKSYSRHYLKLDAIHVLVTRSSTQVRAAYM